jgi:hypothetical protein
MPPEPTARQPGVRAIAPGLRRAGLWTIIAGAALVLFARYGQGSPPWLEAVGLGALVGGWVMFAAVLIMRARARKAPKP